MPVIENDAYGELRYSGEPLPRSSNWTSGGGTVLLRSFSKVSFPGLRVGWAVGPEAADRPAAPGQGSCATCTRTSSRRRCCWNSPNRAGWRRIAGACCEAGAERLAATLAGVRTISARRARAGRGPQGGMNVWVRLPEPLDAGELLARAQREGVAYLPGRYFAVSRLEPGALRLSFAGLAPEQIRTGLAILGSDCSRASWKSASADWRARARDGLKQA